MTTPVMLKHNILYIFSNFKIIIQGRLMKCEDPSLVSALVCTKYLILRRKLKYLQSQEILGVLFCPKRFLNFFKHFIGP